MNRTVLSAILLLSAAALWANDYQIVRLSLSDPNQLKNLTDLNLDFVSEGFTNPCDIVVNDWQLSELHRRGFAPDIVRGKREPFAIPEEYHTYEETYAVFDSLQQLHPDILRLNVIGYSHWRRIPIWGVLFSDNPHQDEDEPAVLLTGVTHAREPLGNEIIIHLARYLCANYSSLPEVRRWVDSLQIWLIPIVNPDGFEYMFESASNYPYWRKNQHDNNGNAVFDPGYDGVDLNRNFDWRWSANGSTNPPDQTYRGAFGNSEAEVLPWCSLALKYQPVLGVSYHSYGAAVYYPWRFQSQGTPDEDVIRTIAQRLGQLLGYTLGNTFGSNQSSDWLYARVGQIDFTIETARNEFIPRAESIAPICQLNFHADTFLFNRVFRAGIWGHVLDLANDSPLVAELQVLDRLDTTLAPRLSEPHFGRYQRLLNPGVYDLRFVTEGYDTAEYVDIPVYAESLTHLEVRLSRMTSIPEPMRLRTNALRPLVVYPNPFAASARIIGRELERFTIYDIAGNQVANCTGANLGSDLLPGVYVVLGRQAMPVRVVKVKGLKN